MKPSRENVFRVMAELEQSGSMPEFIQEQLGVTDGEIEPLRARYLE